jgi:heme-degrading monooxygenase HmoA
MSIQKCVMREWRAEIRRGLKAEYVDYVMRTGIDEYLKTPGNLGATLAVRDLDAERSEMVTLSWWTDRESIEGFAGKDIGRAHYYPEDDSFLLTRPETVQHYEAILPKPGVSP